MSNPGKALFSLFMLLIVVVYIIFGSDINLIDNRRDTYNDAIQAASQAAVLKILDASDINKTYDGTHRDHQDISIDFDTLDDFRSTLNHNLNSKNISALDGISNINIPMAGFVTYDYIIGVTYGEAEIDATTLSSLGYTYDDYIAMPPQQREEIESTLENMRGTYLLPLGYTYYYNNGLNGVTKHTSSGESLDELNDRIWKFTLGDSVYIPDNMYSGTYEAGTGNVVVSEHRYVISEDGKKLCKFRLDNTYDESLCYDMTGWLNSIGFNTLFEFRDYIVTSSINEYLNGYSGTVFNNTASNTGTALEFQLSLAGYSDSFDNYTGKSSIINGPGMFAIIDVYTGSNSNNTLYERIATFGGSELVYTAQENA